MALHRKFWRWYWGAWSGIIAYFFLWAVVFYGDPPWPTLTVLVIQKGILGLLGLVVIRQARRHPLDGFHWQQWRIWGFQLLLCAVLALLGLTVNRFVDSVVFSYAAHEPIALQAIVKRLPEFYGNNYHWILLLQFLVFLSAHWISMEEKIREQEVRTARLETTVLQAQHAALRAQLQPHFLFNTLNSLSQLVHKDPESADRMIGRLGAFFRMTLDRAPKETQTLREELEFIQAYLDIEHIRFGSRLNICLAVPGTLLEAHVPSFILQPLVENAVKHGISGRPEGGTVSILARRSTEALELEVCDDGLGCEKEGTGVGLNNIRSRLELLYGCKGRLLFHSNPEGGTRVTVSLPMSQERLCP